ncbi:unnamed protein product [Effrenium voratum]|uniref:Uncharacterized protein n=1 Tax=Effrenium voratum TaxID=2562239 RepID=A0AA36HW02_9DINO|nr:unnamed protein product [Effrenium voratum]
MAAPSPSAGAARVPVVVAEDVPMASDGTAAGPGWTSDSRRPAAKARPAAKVQAAPCLPPDSDSDEDLFLTSDGHFDQARIFTWGAEKEYRGEQHQGNLARHCCREGL